MSDLKINLQEILQEKQEKIIPENIKKDVQIFDVTGTYEGSGSSGGGDIKLFETVEEMQADDTAKEGDLAVVYGECLVNTNNASNLQELYFPQQVTLPLTVTNEKTINFQDGNIFTSHKAVLSPTSFTFGTMATQVEYSSEDGQNYVRITDLTDDKLVLTSSIDFSRCSNWDANIGYFIQTIGKIFDGLYSYNGIDYVFAENQLTAKPGNLYKASAYSVDGIIEGTLTQEISNSFDDVNAEIYAKVLQYYNNMEPITSISMDMHIIPTRLDGTPLLDISSKTDGYMIFANRSYLTVVPALDISNMTRMSDMFYNCSSLTTVMKLNTSSATDISRMFKKCVSLKDLAILDTSNVTTMIDTFSGCTSLSDDSLNNILQMLINATSYTNTKTLNHIGLSREQATTCTTLSNWAACESAGWTTGY